MPEDSTMPTGAIRRATADEAAAIEALARRLLDYHHVALAAAQATPLYGAGTVPTFWVRIIFKRLWEGPLGRDWLLAREMETDWLDGLADLCGTDVRGYRDGWLLSMSPLPGVGRGSGG